MNTFFKSASIIIFLSLVLLFHIWYFFGPVNNTHEFKTFVVPQNKTNFDLVNSLFEQKLIKNKGASSLLYSIYFKNFEVKEGGYYVLPSNYTWQVFNTLKKDKPDLVWINVKFCPRKEQIGELLKNNLDWSDQELNTWNNLNKGTEYFEGVYYPDTYLIPVNETAEEVAQRFINNFESKFSSLSNGYLDKNIKWTTGIKIASLIAREAAGREDMRLISGVIWNRLNQDMRLQIDATMQYTLGKNENGSWWGSISLKEKQSDSPYNTYKYEGLPPTPICSPNIEFIEAALNPEETECLFYLHDQNKKIYCSETYEEHKEKIEKYLR